jgi:CheY-like chemotaxis protein
MSHELRTPLNSLLILAGQLEENPDNNMTDTQVEYASVIRSSGKDLLDLLNNILNLAKVESGTIAPDMTGLSVRQLRIALLREFEHVAKAKGLGYTIDVAADGPQDIVTDPQRLRQILTNLLANAFKFTERGDVRLQIGMSDGGWSPESESLANASAVVALAVSDTGIGIADEQQQRIFEAFAQGDGTTARLYGGTGLGLSISRELVALLGGEIAVTSTPGEGSTFTVYLPAEGPAATPGVILATPAPTTTPDLVETLVATADLLEIPADVTADLLEIPADAAVDRRQPERPEGGDFNGAKVLIVDDDFRNIFAMTALLERGRAVVTVAESGPDALAALEAMPDMDIVLMDIMMPVMDGYATIRAIREFPHLKSLPIIAVTGKVMPGERQRCIDAGANDFVPKPIDTAELHAVLRPWLPLRAQPAA